MNELTICKSCGYVMRRSRLKEVCPACGVPAKMFEPYTDRLSPRRRFLLLLDIHPVMTHFPQAFTATLLILCGVALAFRGQPCPNLTATISVLGVILPFVVGLSFLAGLLDAKIRFRRVRTPLLIWKMALGGLFFLLSCGIFAVVATQPPTEPKVLVAVLGLSIPAVVCSSILGILGVRLLNSAFPG